MPTTLHVRSRWVRFGLFMIPEEKFISLTWRLESGTTNRTKYTLTRPLTEKASYIG